MHISRGRKVYFHGNHMTKPSVDLLIADIPEGLPVPGLYDPNHVISSWNIKNVDFIQSIFFILQRIYARRWSTFGLSTP